MHKTILACLLGIGALVNARASTVTYDFKTDPSSGPNPIEIFQTGFADSSGASQYWRGSGGNPDGFLAITWPLGGSSTIAVFPDIDQGKIVTSFKFECDLRIGSPQQNVRPADGFSINFARSSDPVFQNHSSGDFATSGAVETGTRTGLAISFDTWAGNTLPDGGDIEGIIVRVDNKTILRQAMPTRNGACDDNTSLQTGPRNAQYWTDANANGTMPDAAFEPASWAQLCWQHLSVELDEQSKLTVVWKGRRILDKYQTTFFPSAGGIVLAGRTGGADEHTHFDNLMLTTTATTVDKTPPTAPGTPSAALVGARFVTIKWAAATDDSGRVGYEVERDGGTPLTANAPEWTETGLLPGTSYSYRIRAVDVSGNGSAWQTVTVKTIAEQDVSGYLLGEIYDGIPGTDVGSLVFSDAYFDKTVSRGVYLPGLSFNVDPAGGFGDNYGIVIKGVLTAPKTGKFDFFVRSDDASQFFLNETGATPPDPALDLWIAEETGCCNAFQEVGAAQTTQVPISLTAGREYGFTFVVKEGGGGDWGEVAMREVGDPTPAASLTPIRGALVKGKGDPTGSDIRITKQPANTTGKEGSFALITVEADVVSPYGVGATYQWNKNGTPIAGGNRQTLVLRNLTAADAGKYSVKIGTMGKSVTSSEATLTVGPAGGGGALDPIQQSADGLVVVEAENYDKLTPQGDHTWQIDVNAPGFSGVGYLDSVPNINVNRSGYPDLLTLSPRLDYKVNFVKTGTHYVWIRGNAIGGSDDSVHAGIDGDNPESARRIDQVFEAGLWVWVGRIEAGGARATIEVASAGVHTVNVWMREDGFKFDKLIITSDEAYVPSKEGPADPRSGAVSGGGGDGGASIVNGLVAYWSFDGNLQDSIKAFHGTARGTTPVAFEDGKAGLGKAIKLDGSNFVEITGGAPTDLNFPGGSMSIAGWFKVGAFDKSWQALISKGEGTNYRVARRSAENSIAYAGGVGEGANDSPDVNEGGWHHFVALSDATGAAFGTALYIDGKMYEINATKPVLANGTARLFIGENPEALNRRWKGSIDDIAIWNRVLTGAEIATLYNGGAGTAISTIPGVPAGGGTAAGGIGIARTATGVTLTFEGTLQSSDSITGPFTDVAGATSPATIPFAGSAKFYRFKK